MKLLKDERIEREAGEVKLTIKPVTTSQQARLVELGALPGVGNRIALTAYCLKNCVEMIRINDIPFDPMRLAEAADLSDTDTMAVMLKIGQVVCDAAFPEVEDIKK